MAKDSKLANKVDKRNTKEKEKRPNLFVRTGRYGKDVVAELKRVTWPTRKELISYTMAVLAFVGIAAVIIGGLDMLFTVGMNLLVQ